MSGKNRATETALHTNVTLLPLDAVKIMKTE
jgi:hypothetical protein